MTSADYLPALVTALQTLDGAQLDRLRRFVLSCRQRDGTLWIGGNGGSYATAAHMAADLTKAGGMRAQLLAANPAHLTAVANDVRYSEPLAAELARYARPGDALLLLSVSGGSGNVLLAWQEASRQRLPVALITASPLPAPVGVVVQVPTRDYGICEDVTAALGHWLIACLREEP